MPRLPHQQDGMGKNNNNKKIKIFTIEVYTLKKDTKFNEIHKTIPKNAKYTSHNIQNEIIDTLAGMALKEIKKYSNADYPGYYIQSDGTRDRCNVGRSLSDDSFCL